MILSLSLQGFIGDWTACSSLPPLRYLPCNRAIDRKDIDYFRSTYAHVPWYAMVKPTLNLGSTVDPSIKGSATRTSVELEPNELALFKKAVT